MYIRSIIYYVCALWKINKYSFFLSFFLIIIYNAKHCPLILLLNKYAVHRNNPGFKPSIRQNSSVEYILKLLCHTSYPFFQASPCEQTAETL